MATEPQHSTPPAKPGLHPRNRHRSRYDFAALCARTPELVRFLRPSPHGDATIDYADPAALLALNRALLLVYYGLADWFLPPDYLCPPIPGRADYLHYVADLLATANNGTIPRGPSISVLDLGTGANLVYPILGRAEYGWRFVATDIDPAALHNAERLVAANPTLAGFVEFRRQPSATALLRGIVHPGERFDLTLCNPPFHASAAAAAAGSARKTRNLGSARPGRSAPLNFGGRPAELWCPGGEVAFISRLIAESADFRSQIRWFTTLVSSRDSLPRLRRALAAIHPAEVRTIDMAQGQKRSRLLAWTFGEF
jgi:23S rRNA (adenine1618-N6)-methyltransferase